MSVGDVTVRHATIEDAQVLSEFTFALADEHLDTIGGESFTPEHEREFLENAAAQERALILVACDGRRVVGMLDLWAGKRPQDRHAARLGMTVLGPYRSKGIGRRLLERAIKETEAWPGFCRIELTVVPWNDAAIKLYESVGFVREGTKKKAINYRGKPEDFILMALVK